MRSTRVLGWRRVATAIWRGPADPQIYGILELDARPALELIARARAAGVHVTITHVVGRALARALRSVPEMNVRLRFGRHLRRETVDVFFITAVAGGRDLSGVKVIRADERSVMEIAHELSGRAQRLRTGEDPSFARSKRLMERLPFFLLRPVLRLFAWLAGDLGRTIAPLGVEASPFGSAMITSVGMFGLQLGFAPLAWLYKVPLLLLVGEITQTPMASASGEGVEVRPILPLTASIDHRYVDGAQLARLVSSIREYLADPLRFEPELQLVPALSALPTTETHAPSS